MGLPRHGARGGNRRAEGRGGLVRGRRGGVRGLRVRRFVRGRARGVRARHDGDPDLQRQQQLLDGLHRAVRSRALDPRRARRLRAGDRLREDGEGLAGGEVQRPRAADGAALRQARRAVRVRGGAPGPDDVRHGRPRAHALVRVDAGAFRVDRLQEPQALGQQPLCAVPGRVHAGADRSRSGHLCAADQAPVLAHLRRIRRSRPRVGALPRGSRSVGSRCGDRRAVDGDGHDLDLRGCFGDQHRRRQDDGEGSR